MLEESVGALESEELESTGVVSTGALSVAVGTSAPCVIVMYSVTVVVASDPSSVHEPVSDAAGMSDDTVVYVVIVVVPPLCRSWRRILRLTRRPDPWREREANGWSA